MPPVVVLDACVLYPAAQRDLFMWLAAGGVIRAHWTHEIHEEWMRNVARDFNVKRNVLSRVRELMDSACGDALISHYRHHEKSFPHTNPKDRHVAAAAVAARKRSAADTVAIVTWNVKDFDRQELVFMGLTAENPDAFLCGLLSTSPKAVIHAFTRMRENLRNPSKTNRQCVQTLAAQGLKSFARSVSTLLD